VLNTRRIFGYSTHDFAEYSILGAEYTRCISSFEYCMEIFLDRLKFYCAASTRNEIRKDKR